MSHNASRSSLPRRQFITTVALAAGGFSLIGCKTPRKYAANERLNIGCIGVAGRAGENNSALKDQNIVAICDVDANNLAKAAQQFPSAKTYRDFRRLIDQRDLDAIVVSTPDHTHAVAVAAALRSGRHVYCEKPLTHTVSEARHLTELARKTGLVTQMGTQIHSGNNYRRVVELIQSGAIGEVRDVHVWVNSSYGGKARPTDSLPVPKELDWDLWLGPAAFRPYHKEYVPFNWRHWWSFGGGSLADFGCHFMDLPFWALGLKYPDVVEPLSGPAVDAESTPPWLVVRYHFPARPDAASVHTRSALNLTWYHGGKRPEALVPEPLYKRFVSGVLFVGSKGQLISDYSRHILLPEEHYKDFQRPAEFIPNSIGHHKEWVEAIKTGKPTTCHFGYGGPLTETALLGNVAFRTGQRLEWDAQNLRAKNSPQADQYIQHQYRKGWKL